MSQSVRQSVHRLLSIINNFAIIGLCFVAVSCNDAKVRPPKTETPVGPKGDTKEPVIDTSLEMWHLKAPATGFEGISLTQLPDAKSDTEVIVAVIDSGVDINHVALKNKIWINSKEVPANGVDDDNNGYIDDINGWNFMGNPDGNNINFDTLEVTREALRYDKKLAAGESMTYAEIKYFEGVKKDYEALLVEAKKDFEYMDKDYLAAKDAEQLLRGHLGWVDFTAAGLESITSVDTKILDAKKLLITLVNEFGALTSYYEYRDYYKDALAYNYNKDFDPRATIVKNDDTDFSEFNYGNNNVIGADPGHGTHVAGIIAAEASANYKTRGISQNAKIMVLRTVPNGDERDKDIVASVRYAVNNGARIINMSFGKNYSPFKSEVDKAFLWAEEKGVLIIHAAGNNGRNVDSYKFFPNRILSNNLVLNRHPEIQGWLEIGASAAINGLPLLAKFSNYGIKSVDLFSPGVKILSTMPNQEYAMLSGTSMASPVAAGAASVIMNRYPNINAQQTRKIMMDQVRTNYDRIRLPGAEKFDLPVFLKEISIAGGILDLEKSVLLIEQLSK